MIASNSIKKILKRAGALRVSKGAIRRFKKEVSEYSSIIARRAVKNAQYSGRKTIKFEDVYEAIKESKEKEAI